MIAVNLPHSWWQFIMFGMLDLVVHLLEFIFNICSASCNCFKESIFVWIFDDYLEGSRFVMVFPPTVVHLLW